MRKGKFWYMSDRRLRISLDSPDFKWNESGPKMNLSQKLISELKLPCPESKSVWNMSTCLLWVPWKMGIVWMCMMVLPLCFTYHFLCLRVCFCNCPTWPEPPKVCLVAEECRPFQVPHAGTNICSTSQSGEVITLKISITTETPLRTVFSGRSPLC